MNLKIYNKLLQYINAPKDGEKILNDLSKEELYLYDECLEDIDNILSSEEPNFELMWKNIDSKTKPSFSKRLITPLIYAASIIIIFMISFVLLKYNNPKNYNIANKINYTDSKSKLPNLVLDNGEIIKLSSNKMGVIHSNDKINIKKTNNTLCYTKKTKKPLKVKYNTLIIPKAGTYNIELEDGSIVYLNSDSKLKYPSIFCGKERIVELEGEAYFKVKKDKKHPFIVRTRGINIRVLGTSFNVNSYKENKDIITTLVEGSVKIKAKDKKVVLKPNQQAIIKENSIVKKKVEARKYISWIDGKYYFEKVKLINIMNLIERWYDVKVFFIDENVKNKKFTGVIKNKFSIKEILEMLEKTDDLKFKIINKNVYIKNSSAY